MWLIDTSTWIDFLRGTDNQPVLKLKDIIETGVPFYLTPIIFQEILQGADSEKRFTQYETYFSTQLFVFPSEPIETFTEAARIYFLCRKKGITIRSTINCIIAQIAIEHSLILIHNDDDFHKIETVIKKLKIFHPLNTPSNNLKEPNN